MIATSERIHIAFFGRCNSGKSSLFNALAGQEFVIVSELAGTTTDPVSKAIELPGIGASVLIDTAGLDDNSELGRMRVLQTQRVLDKTDIAILLFTPDGDFSIEIELLEELKLREIPVLLVVSKAELIIDDAIRNHISSVCGEAPLLVSAKTLSGVDNLIESIAQKCVKEERLITDGVCNAGDLVLLVMPQDAQAPKGRLIKPQVEVLRELLDRGCRAMCCTTDGLSAALASLSSPPKLIITDSQVFSEVSKLKPNGTELTSFSILFARYKGDIDLFTEGAKRLDNLTATSRVLIAEACTHVPQHEDIGRVKLPRLLRQKVGEGLTIDIVGGADFPEDLSQYDLVIHCGACMFTRRHVMNRVSKARRQGVSITNYGLILAQLLKQKHEAI